MGQLKAAGYEITNNSDEADTVVVNTCGFIESAKQELEQKKSINYPLNHGEYSGIAVLIRSIIFRL